MKSYIVDLLLIFFDPACTRRLKDDSSFTTFFILIVLFFSYNGVAFIRFLKRYVIIIDIKGGYKHGQGWIASRYGTTKFFFKE